MLKFIVIVTLFFFFFSNFLWLGHNDFLGGEHEKASHQRTQSLKVQWKGQGKLIYLTMGKNLYTPPSSRPSYPLASWWSVSLARQNKDLWQHLFLGLQKIFHNHPLLARHDQCLWQHQTDSMLVLLGLAWQVLTSYTCSFLFESQLVLPLLPSQVFII